MPTNKPIMMNGMIIDRFVDGRVVEGWDCYDMYGVMQQLGAIPAAE